MSKFSFPSLFAWAPPKQPWVCSRCLRQQRRAKPLWSAQYSTTASVKHGPKARRRRRNILLASAAGGTATAAAGSLAFADDIKHAYTSVERTGRVVTTLLMCINDYRVTLKHKHDTETDYDDMLKACHKRCAERTFVAMEKNGSIFIKLGQHLSSLNYLLPSEWCTTFIPLQDKCPVSSYESIAAMVEQDTGHAISEYFDNFTEQPIGAASLAQVHTATLKETGQKVAVKMQHPALDEWAPLDLALTRFTFNMLRRAFPEYDLTWLSSEMEVSLPKELDFAEEGRNAVRCKEYFAPIKTIPLIIPSVVWGQRRILVMEYVTGARPDDLNYLDDHGIDRDEVSASLARLFNTMIFATDAPLHCDPHGGNIAIRHNPHRGGRHNFDIILYDHGLYRDIPTSLRRSYAKLWLAVIDADEPRMRKYAQEVAGITDEQFPLFASAITGRDYGVLKKGGSNNVAATRQPGEGSGGGGGGGGGVAAARSEEERQREKENISAALGEGLLPQLVQLLGQVPRIILLILKTNDLTRSLDEGLQTREGPVRSFLILARYAARAVWEEQVENFRARGPWPPANLWALLANWLGYMKISLKLSVYESWLGAKRVVGVKTEMPM